MKLVLQANNLVKEFGEGRTRVRAVNDVSLEVRRGELVLVMGPSGSGKTTLISMLGGLLHPTHGSILLDGTAMHALRPAELAQLRAHGIGFVFQSFNLLEALSAEENILFPARLLPGRWEEARERAEGLMERLGLQARRKALPRTLSGGERQRVAIARALINAPPLILADEPTGNLDSVSGQEVVMVLHDIARDEGRAVILVTHDPRVEEVADRVLWLEDGALRDRKRERKSWVRDPVCGMRVDASTAEYCHEVDGRRVVVCSRRCLERLRSEPEKYLAERAGDPPAAGSDEEPES